MSSSAVAGRGTVTSTVVRGWWSREGFSREDQHSWLHNTRDDRRIKRSTLVRSTRLASNDASRNCLGCTDDAGISADVGPRPVHDERLAAASAVTLRKRLPSPDGAQSHQRGVPRVSRLRGHHRPARWVTESLEDLAAELFIAAELLAAGGWARNRGHALRGSARARRRPGLEGHQRRR